MDRFELLLELPAHHGEVWALALSAYGDFLLSGKVIQTTDGACEHAPCCQVFTVDYVLLAE